MHSILTIPWRSFCTVAVTVLVCLYSSVATHSQEAVKSSCRVPLPGHQQSLPLKVSKWRMNRNIVKIQFPTHTQLYVGHKGFMQCSSQNFLKE